MAVRVSILFVAVYIHIHVEAMEAEEAYRRSLIEPTERVSFLHLYSLIVGVRLT
jgi:hypothetical protein